MSLTAVENTYYNNTTVNIPGNAKDIYIRIAGGQGGTGSGCASFSSFGRSRDAILKVNQDLVSRNFQLYVGKMGGNGSGGASGGGGSGSGAVSGGFGSASPYSYQCGTQCVHIGGFCDGCPSGMQPDGAYGGCGGFCDPPRRDAGIVFCACCKNFPVYCTAYAGGGGGGGGASAVYIDNVIAAVSGGGGGGRGSSNCASGASASVFSAVNGTFSLFNGANGGGGGSGGGTGGGGGGAQTSVAYNTSARSRYNSQLVTLWSTEGIRGGDGRIIISYNALVPEIESFFYTGGNSADGVPDDTIVFNFAIVDFISATLSGPWGSTVFNSGDALTYAWTPITQSNVEANQSPVSHTISLTATAGSESDFASIDVQITNDNTPSTAWTTSFQNLEPNTTYDLVLGTLAGVDMPTTISTSGNGNFMGLNNSYSGSINYSVNNQVKLRTTTVPFNTDVSGLAADAEFGKTNSKTVPVTTPSGTFNVTVTTRAPKIRETFDYFNNVNKFPYEDIDLVTNTPEEYVTSAQLDADDIEIPMEIKTDDPDAQVSINNGAWQNTREM
jgi:hypothetical protein